MIKLTENKAFLRKIIFIGIPVLLQNLISIGLNLIDTLMIGMLGEQALAAVGAANQVFFIFSITLFGLFSGAAIYTAQYWGAKDIPGVQRMLGINYLVGSVLAVVVSLVAAASAPQIIRLFSKEDMVINLGVEYLRIVVFSYFFSAVSFAISYNSRAIQNLAVPTAINALALGVNALLNWFLIFGVGPFPELGVKGAAIATLIARIFECVSLIVYVYTRKEHPLKTGFKNLFGFTKAHFAKVMKMAIPVIFTEDSWALSMTLIYSAYGLLGTSAFAVAQVANVVSDLLQSVYFGVGNATAMIIGETLGTGDKKGAYNYGLLSIKTVGILNIIVTVLLLLISKPIAGIYNFNPETTRLLMVTLMTLASVITPKMFGYIFIVGILRAGGDTVFSMKVEVFCNLLVQMPIAFFAVLVLRTTLPIAIVLGELGNVIRIVVCWPRFKSRKWINIVTG